MTARTLTKTVEAPVEETGANGHEPTDEPTTIGSLTALEDLLKQDDRPIRRVRVPEWPGKPTFLLRAMTGRERDAVERSTPADYDQLSARVVVRCLVTEDGKPLVPKARIAEMEAKLGERQAGGLLRLMKAVQRLSGLDESDLQEMLADLKGIPSSSSGTN
jgi:hypothetical protein